MELSSAKQIELEDKKKFDEYFEKFQPEISEFSFTNLFIWKDYYNFLFLEVDDHLIIFSRDYFNKWKKSVSKIKDGFFFLPPIFGKSSLSNGSVLFLISIPSGYPSPSVSILFGSVL